ncbi:Oxysterol-binding protein [Pleurostoma richardsiae]|uniref:Oxysterol-binding protein n=1 Tax=Pleurostoma richardsiae TaxID=41990 RepID=A0AA38S5M0_9PEZI|nr:Oxysterol-binding protein [Pleurostoma richardsiae]
MAGIEQLEIHSKSYIVRWVKVEEGHSISWSVQPHKKSINFGIVKHPGSGSTNLATNHLPDGVSTHQLDEHGGDSKAARFARKAADTAEAQLAKKGFIIVLWHGKCEADKVTIGTFDCPPGQGGMFGLVFDNTFSKQTSKTATFVLLTYPTGAPPKTAHHLPNLQTGQPAATSKTSLGKHSSPRMGGTAPSDSVDSLPSHAGGQKAASIAGKSEAGSTRSHYHVGTLLKRRRKKGQGYARRYFSLDYTTCTLSYFHNRNSSALRGAIPLSLAAIAADERRREISIDSGAEIWHLKASNDKEFIEWARALERASRIARGLEPLPEPSPERLHVTRSIQAPPNTQQEEDKEWQQVEALVSRVAGTRDALRRLVKDISAHKQQSQQSQQAAYLSQGSTASGADDSSDYFTPVSERKPFWKRKSSASALTPQAFSPSVSSSLAVPTPSTVTTITANGSKSERRRSKGSGGEHGMQEHCAALLADLDSVVAEFSNLLNNSKRRRLPVPASALSRKSYESTSTTEEFFDAEAGEADRSQILRIDNHSEEETPVSDADEGSVHDSSSVSSVEEEEEAFTTKDATHKLFPTKPKSLAPLPVTVVVKRRTTIPPAKVPPPSLIAFVRKNVGKDLSTISMPVTSNEPISLLQRTAEQLEYARLLDTASKQKRPQDRLLYVTAFAISQFSSTRAKERANRKPFNPLLGETYELLLSETEIPGGMRLLVEKVSHRPVRLALHADGLNWSFAQSPAPAQKFWGKSAEITTEGRARICLRLADAGDEEEYYSFNVATVFLRNVVMGEKYAEPVGTMQVLNESTGARAAVEFRSKGMFGGRGEEVQVEIFEPDGTPAGTGMTGTWTGSLKSTAGGEEVWRAGRLVANAASTYGLTEFAAALNEITDLERGRLPPTDTRLRPDQRFAEEGELDAAEEWKVKLEEAQRRRRKALEERGEEHRPRWFVRAAPAAGQDGEEVWKIKGGREGYWEARERGQWSGVEDIFVA